MSKYVIEAPHTKEECLNAVTEVMETDSQLLSQFQWGCPTGVHTGWAIVEGKSESAVQDTLPSTQRGRWRITEVTKFTPEQIEAYHREYA